MTEKAIDRLREVARWGNARLRGEGVGAVLARGAIAYLIVQAVGSGLNFLLHVVLARELGANEYGRFAYALNWILMLVVVVKLGLDVAVLRFFPVYVVHQWWGLLRGLLFSGTIVTATTGILIAVGALALSSRIWPAEEVSLHDTLAVGLVLLPLQGVAFFWGGILRGLKKVMASQIPLTIVYPLMMVLGALGWHRLSSDAFGSAGAMALAVVATAVALLLLGVNLRSAMAEIVRPAERVADVPTWARAAAPLFAMSLLQILAAKGSVLIIGSTLGPTDAGLYFAADRLASLMSLGAVAINSWAAPLIAELYGGRRMEELQRLVVLGTRGLVAYSLPIALAMAVGGPWILALFGREFVEARWALAILVAGQFAGSLVGPAGFLPTMTGHQKEASIVEAVMTTTSLALAFALIPSFGIEGAAAATALAFVLRHTAMAVLARKKIGIRAFIF